MLPAGLAVSVSLSAKSARRVDAGVGGWGGLLAESEFMWLFFWGGGGCFIIINSWKICLLTHFFFFLLYFIVVIFIFYADLLTFCSLSFQVSVAEVACRALW